MSTARKPAITRTISHPADAIPDRPPVLTPPAAPPEPAPSAPLQPPAAQAGGGAEPPVPAPSAPFPPPAAQAGGGAARLTAQHNVIIRPSTKARLGKAVDKLRYETGDRTISIASITDQALDAYLTQHSC